GSSRPFTSGQGGAQGKQRVITCYNCKGEGHMSKQCTKPRRKRDAEWFKDKVLLALGFQNPRYLKKAQQLKPNLYNGSVIGKSDVIVVPDSEKTLMHAEEKSYAEQAFWSQYSVQSDELTHSVKERTTATAITEGTWGFEHTKACFRDEIIPFVKNLKDLFTSFDQYLIDEVSEVQKTFKQMELAVEQNCAAKAEFQIKMESVLKENDCLLKHALGVDIV
nr:hypothetical protein [Tanacetum cinerariifolium]